MFIFSNTLNTTLASPVTASADTIVLASAQGLPVLATGDMMPLVLLSASTASSSTPTKEIVYVTAINLTTLTVLRAQEGTAALPWNVGDFVYCSFTNASVMPSNAVAGGSLAGTLPNPTIAAGVVQGSNIAGGTIQGSNIAAGTVQGSNIAAGTIAEGNLGSGAIHRAQLSTATAASMLGLGPLGAGNLSLAGGEYSYWAFGSNSTASSATGYMMAGNGNPGLGVMGIYCGTQVSGSTSYIYINENYINSSPPYNFGESFIYVAFDKNNKIVGVSAALDPTWAHHGPHSIVPTHWSKSGKPMIWQETLDGVIFTEALKDDRLFRAYHNGEIEVEKTEVEITIDYKDLDKDIHPHPFGSDSIARVVMMHPDSKIANRLTKTLQAGGASEIVKRIESGIIVPGTTSIAYPHAPKGIDVVKFKIK